MKIAVIGAGLMGSGITQVCAQAGYEVKNIDVFKPAIVKAKANMEKIFAKKIAKGSMSQEQKNEIFARITYSGTMEDVKGSEIIIEAVPEKMELKKSVFAQLDEAADLETIIVSNTSGLSISEMAAVTKRPHKVMGVHFFYPAPVMKLVELVRGLATDEETYQKVK